MDPQHQFLPPETKTLRDEFAMAALTGLLANEGVFRSADKNRSVPQRNSILAAEAYAFADQMLNERLQ